MKGDIDKGNVVMCGGKIDAPITCIISESENNL